MSSTNDHVILNHIDAPTRILFWSATEFICCFAPIILGLFIGQIGLGVGLSILSIVCFKAFQKRFGQGKLAAILYWYFPSFNKHRTPPSHVKLWVPAVHAILLRNFVETYADSLCNIVLAGG